MATDTGTVACGNTRAITRTEPAWVRCQGIVIGALSIAAGLALVIAAIPLGASGLAEVPGNPVLKRLHDGNPRPEALRGLIRSRKASLAWRETGRAAKELGLAHMMLAESGPGTERDQEYVLAEQALLRGLALAPVDPYAWTRLALVRMAQRRPPEEVASALGLALASGPNEDALLRPTVRAALHSWEALDAGRRREASRRIRAAWRADPVRTASDAAAMGQAELLAQIALPSGPDNR